MNEENNGQSPGAVASPRLSKVVIMVIIAHVVLILGIGMFTLLKGNTSARDGTELTASAEETRDSAASNSAPPAESGGETVSGDVAPVTPDNTAVGSAPTSAAPAPSWNTTVTVPVQSPPAAQPRVANHAPVATTPASSDSGTYTVQKGDTLSKISRQFNVSVAELKQSNGLVSDALKTGQLLKVPAAGSGIAPSVTNSEMVTNNAPSPASAGARPTFRIGPPPALPVTDSATAPAYQTYKVAPGDTLYKIARQFNTKADVIAKANNLSDPSKLKVGAELKVPLSVRETARPVAPAALQDVNVARLPQNRN